MIFKIKKYKKIHHLTSNNIKIKKYCKRLIISQSTKNLTQVNKLTSLNE